ncbi:MAG TPA: hypothetical protein VFE15_14770 [Marmoricola sp.]|nr:hypothetical protein [Marmoricola sp.]
MAITVPGASAPQNNGLLFLTYFVTLGLVLGVWRLSQGRQIRRYFEKSEPNDLSLPGRPESGSEPAADEA